MGRRKNVSRVTAGLITAALLASSPIDAQDLTISPVEPGQSPQAPFVVEGQKLGAHVDQNSPAFSGFHCSPSESFVGATWCQKLKQLGAKPSDGASLSSVLYEADGTIQYANRFVNVANFAPGDIDAELGRLSRIYHEQAQVFRLPHRDGQQDALIAVWGKIRLEPLDDADLGTLASGKSPSAGLFVDYLGDFRQSARRGLPVYRISGGAGYLWAASYDAAGHGNLRLSAADMSRIKSKAIAAQASDPGPLASSAKAKADLQAAAAAAAEKAMREAFAAALPRLSLSGQEALKTD